MGTHNKTASDRFVCIVKGLLILAFVATSIYMIGMLIYQFIEFIADDDYRLPPPTGATRDDWYPPRQDMNPLAAHRMGH